MSKTVKFIIVSLIIIIGAGVVLALYYRPSLFFPSKSDNSAVLSVSSLENTGIINNTIVPTANSVQFSTTQPFKATIFIDGNNNGVRDTGEGPCVSCLLRQLVCSKTGLSTNPKVSDLLDLSIGATGGVPTNSLNDGYVCWASLDDKKIIIPPFTIAVGDSSAELNIPAVSSQAVLSGVNNHIVTILHNNDGSYTYTFDLLIPILQTQFTSNKPIWIKYTPNLSALDSYFITSANILFDKDGSITGDEETYYIKLNWHFSENYSTDRTVENITLIM